MRGRSAGDEPMTDAESVSAVERDPEGVVACSPVSGNVYLVYRYEDQGDGKLVSKDKRVLKRDDIGVLASIERVHEAARRAYQVRRKA